MGVQGVSAALRDDIQVQGQGKTHQLCLLPGQENAGQSSGLGYNQKLRFL